MEQFPLIETLEDDEVKIIVEKILETWAAYNYIADLPKRLPIRIAYKCLLDTWSEKVSRIPTGGHFHFDFHEEELEQYIL